MAVLITASGLPFGHKLASKYNRELRLFSSLSFVELSPSGRRVIGPLSGLAYLPA